MGEGQQVGQAVSLPVEIMLDRPRQLKYGIGILRQAEAAVGGFVGPLGLTILCTLLLYGLRTDDPKLTLGKLDGLLDKYLQGEGSLVALNALIREALARAGVSWGKAREEEEEPSSSGLALASGVEEPT